jgi:hypothetical protein
MGIIQCSDQLAIGGHPCTSTRQTVIRTRLLRFLAMRETIVEPGAAGPGAAPTAQALVEGLAALPAGRLSVEE